jgi:predicted TIM-barrel fold metal-dependent hydrolase
MLDLSDAPVIDSHCHPWRNDVLMAADPAGFENRITMMGMCLLSSNQAGTQSAEHISLLTASTPLVLTMRRRLAQRLGCEPSPQAVMSARHAALVADPATYNRALFTDNRVIGLIYDEGYPQPTIPYADFAAATGVPIHRVARIEPWIAAMRGEAASYAKLEDAFMAKLEEAASDQRLVAFKSVIAYRTGLDIGKPSPDECRRAFERWRADDFRETREHAKPVRDTLLRRMLSAARHFDRPVHIHCGGGDPDIVLRHAHPQDLFALLREHSNQPIVLIHAGWPWTEEAAFIASILPHVYLDISVMVPWASLAIDQKLEILLGVAPPAKVLYGSDEASEPEVIWLAAQLAREALGRVLDRAIDRRWLDESEARDIAEGVLARNTQRLHGIGG